MSKLFTERLKLHIDTIDSQHNDIFEHIEMFQNACQQQKGRDEVLKSFKFIKQYTIKHFKDEEAFMLKNKYPKYQEHKKAHELFIKMVSDFEEKIGDEITISTIIGMNKINGALSSHILNIDRQLADFINKK